MLHLTQEEEFQEKQNVLSEFISQEDVLPPQDTSYHILNDLREIFSHPLTSVTLEKVQELGLKSTK
jgi:hypothetical protein